MWLNQNFLLQEDMISEGASLNVAFTSLRGSGPVVFNMEQNGQVVHLFLPLSKATENWQTSSH